MAARVAAVGGPDFDVTATQAAIVFLRLKIATNNTYQSYNLLSMCPFAIVEILDHDGMDGMESSRVSIVCFPSRSEYFLSIKLTLILSLTQEYAFIVDGHTYTPLATERSI
jgi:hypothetical protein